VLEAARLTASGINSQHWRFILLDEKTDLKKLAEDSTSGKWVAGANFAIITLTDPKYNFHLIDAGRVLQDMQLAAWNYGVGSGVYTGVNREGMSKDFGVPPGMNVSVVVGFGYPVRKIIGRKNRKPLDELAFSGKFGQKLSV
jgi:nitroreductase